MAVAASNWEHWTVSRSEKQKVEVVSTGHAFVLSLHQFSWVALSSGRVGLLSHRCASGKEFGVTLCHVQAIKAVPANTLMGIVELGTQVFDIVKGIL